jgi:hypothetical protein
VVAGSLTDAAVPEVSTTPLEAAFSAAAFDTTGSAATVAPSASSAQLPEPANPAPLTDVVQPAAAPAAALTRMMAAP